MKIKGKSWEDSFLFYLQREEKILLFILVEGGGAYLSLIDKKPQGIEGGLMVG